MSATDALERFAEYFLIDASARPAASKLSRRLIDGARCVLPAAWARRKLHQKMQMELSPVNVRA
jgi:hypothetical protein